jgi:ribosomal protein S18 acetylase RimI-like enzyme
VNPTLRPADPHDFAFCQRLYFEGTNGIIAALGLDEARQIENFAHQWAATEVCIITGTGEDVGWLQTMALEDALYLGQLYVDRRYQRQGIGQAVVRLVVEEAARDEKGVCSRCGYRRQVIAFAR